MGEKGTPLGVGREATVPFSESGAGGSLPWGTPTQHLPTSRTKGLGSTVGGRGTEVEGGGKAGRGGRGERLPTFPLAAECGKLSPANASLRSLLNPGGLGFLT